jgi:conjugative transfer signal peptidase TraF
MPFADVPIPGDRKQADARAAGRWLFPQSARPLPFAFQMTTAVGLLAISLLVILSSSMVGYRFSWNLTDSVPRGIYWRSEPPRGEPEFRIGDLVLLSAPRVVQKIIEDRRYLPVGAQLLKRIVAAPGDHVCFKGEVFRVNDRTLAQILTTDSLGRRLPISAFCGAVPVGFVVVGTTATRSIDSRNFGPVSESQLEKARPLWTW